MNYKQLLIAFSLCSTITLMAQKQTAINPGAVWPDTDNHHIQAHGGGIIKVGKKYYWYGEERRQGLDTNFRFVSCYTSHDLINWKFEGDVLKLSNPDSLLQGRWV